jgi:hypothetical protein
MCGVQTTNGDLGLIWDSLPFTASTDAAVALAERVLPGKWPGILRSALSDLGNRNDWHICLVRPDQIRALPTAIVLATLRALQAKENGR